MGLDVEQIRKDFPILQRKFRGKTLAYLDNAATSQKPIQVIDAISDYYKQNNANPHRGAYALSLEATQAYEGGREKVAKFIGAGKEEVVFVRNATEGMNLIAYILSPTLAANDTVLLTQMEHHANIVPWQLAAKRTGCKVEYAPITAEGVVDMAAFEGLVKKKKPKIVSFVHISNVLGTINDAQKMCKIAKEGGAIAIVDCAQSAPHMRINAKQMGCDFLVFTGHKMLAPMGTGVVFGRRELLEKYGPFLGGGDMIREVKFDGSTWNDIPWKFEAGTPNVECGVGFSAAIDYLNKAGLENIRAHEVELTAYAHKRLGEIPGLRIFGLADASKKGGVVSFKVDKVHPHDIATVLDEDAIAVRAGNHCAQPLVNLLGEIATTRASFYLYNTKEEIDRLAQAVARAAKIFG